MTIAVLIVAAGRGTRAGSTGGVPKQYHRLAGRTVLDRAIEPFIGWDAIGPIQVVIHPDDRDTYGRIAGPIGMRVSSPVSGGATRQASVRAGLEALAPASPHSVLIHDAARPLLPRAVVGRVLAALDRHVGVVAALPASDTLKQADSNCMICGTVDRTNVWRAQTPQGFRFEPLLEAHRQAEAQGLDQFTDDAALAEWAGIPVHLVQGSETNLKITRAEDLDIAQRLLGESAYETRNGTGFDVHRFTAGDHVWLCGVRIPHSQALDGHSDADVGMHALTDAILGALGDGDIGQHFPPQDSRWRGAPSRLFLEDAARRVAARSGRIINVDVTLLCEAPRIGPYRDAMKAAVSSSLGLLPDRVGVKATTTEGLGFTGRREGIAAMAAATLLLPA